MATAKTTSKRGGASSASEPVKKSKTGGRVTKSTVQKIEEAKLRSAIAALDDDTTLDSELSALYLAVSKSAFGKLTAGSKDSKASPSSKGAPAVAGPPIIKIFDEGAVGQNQPVQFKLGALREFQKKWTFANSFDAAVGAGLAGWCSLPIPFFAEVETRAHRGRQILLGAAWDLGVPSREKLFKAVVEKRIRVVNMTPADAASSRWGDLSAHKRFAKPWLALLKVEASAVKAAIEGTDIAMATNESEVKRGSHRGNAL